MQIGSGTTRFTAGTGRFRALRGTLTDDHEYDTDPKRGYNGPTAQGHYWLSK